MKNGVFLLMSYLAFLGMGTISATAQLAGDELIFPDPRSKVVVAMVAPRVDVLTTGRILTSGDPVAAAVLQEMNLEYNARMLRMSQCARNLAGDREGPNLLYVSKNEGGFPRTGVALTDENGTTRSYPQLHYVDLVLDQQRIDRGDMSIYSHELGHVMMDIILSNHLERQGWEMSPKQHVSMGVTDYLTAFYEGWGIHFQRLAYDQEPKYRRTFEEKLSLDRSIGLAWHSGLDEYLRINLVKENGYIYEKHPVRSDPQNEMPIVERILAEHTSPAFDRTRIKTAQQMLSCEGVAATLFYQVAINPKISHNYQETEFYNRFLIKSISNTPPIADLFTPLENVILKNLHVYDQMARIDIKGSPLMAWVETWCREFPADRDELLRLFLMVTKGATVSPELVRLTERINYLGQIGAHGEFMEAFRPYEELFSGLVDRVRKDPAALTADIGPELWVSTSEVKIRRTLWMPEPVSDLSVNINTASQPELEAFLGPDQARRFIEARRARRYFNSLQEAEELGFRF